MRKTSFGRNPALHAEHAGGFMHRANREGKPFFLMVSERLEMRSIIERRYGYIYNGWSGNGEQFQDETGKGLALEAMIQAARTDLEIARRVLFFLFRAPRIQIDRTGGVRGFGGTEEPRCFLSGVSKRAYPCRPSRAK